MSGYVNTANLQPLRVLTHTLTSYNKVMVTDAIANRAYFHLKAETRCKIQIGRASCTPHLVFMNYASRCENSMPLFEIPLYWHKSIKNRHKIRKSCGHRS